MGSKQGNWAVLSLCCIKGDGRKRGDMYLRIQLLQEVWLPRSIVMFISDCIVISSSITHSAFTSYHWKLARRRNNIEIFYKVVCKPLLRFESIGRTEAVLVIVLSVCRNRRATKSYTPLFILRKWETS